VGDAIYYHSAGSANSLSTIVIKFYGISAVLDELLVQYVKNLEKGHVGIDVRNGIDLKSSGFRRPRLTPYFQFDVHAFCHISRKRRPVQGRRRGYYL
jgi:hypothetical protein